MARKKSSEIYQKIAEDIKIILSNKNHSEEEVKAHKQLYYDCLHKATNMYSGFISKAALELRKSKKKPTLDHALGRYKLYSHGVDMTLDGWNVGQVRNFFMDKNFIILVAPEENKALERFQKSNRDWITYEEYISVTGVLYKLPKGGRWWKAKLDETGEARQLFDMHSYYK
jgi:hypothetical protein